MHDGYLFTLGICGSASAASPATALLDAMLAALPPVKRAAYLGEIVDAAALVSDHDELVAETIADFADAELLLLVTPTHHGILPPRFARVLNTLAQYVSSAERHLPAAVLVTVGAVGSIAPALPAAIQRLPEIYQLHFVGDLPLGDQAITLARSAYAAARRRQPAALPYQH
jgi:NAD(P)H-dependent FMN reductase